jgi:uncharacterized protein YcnI
MRRLLVVLAVAAALVVANAGPLSAHVSIVPPIASKGSFSTLSFNTPNERSDANTVKLEVTFPTDTPIPFVSVKPVPGWTWSAEKTTLTTPIKTDDGQITQAVSKITWTATAGGLKPGEFDQFTISAGPLPTKVKSLTFKAVQTYSNGDVVNWIEARVKRAPEPAHPAPTLKLTKRAKG